MQYFISRIPIILNLALMAYILGCLLGAEHAKADNRAELVQIAHKSHLYVSRRALDAFIEASRVFDIPAKELFSISVIESNLNPNAFRVNNNGSYDIGLMQVNSINKNKCTEYDINTILGNVMCGAKILNQLKQKHSDYLGRYHSATPKYKNKYIAKVSKILYTLD